MESLCSCPCGRDCCFAGSLACASLHSSVSSCAFIPRRAELTGISSIECAAACSLLNEAALTRSSSCLFRSSENPACSMFRCAERPPSSIASSVIWDRRRAIAPFISSSSFVPSASPPSFVFFEELSAFCRRWQAAENRLDAGAVAAMEGHIEARRNCELQSCLPVISRSIVQLSDRMPKHINKQNSQQCKKKAEEVATPRTAQRQTTPTKSRLVIHLRGVQPSRIFVSRIFFMPGANLLLSTRSLAASQFFPH